MQTRRHFLQASAGASMTIGLAGVVNSAPEAPVEWRNKQQGMRYRRLGQTGFMVSEIVMGGNEINPDNYEHVLRALDAGLNYLDTSPAYGRGKSELGFAKVIQARPRDTFFLTSKVSLWDNNRNDLFQKIFDGLTPAEQNKLRRTVAEEIDARGAANPQYLVNYFGSQRRELEATTISNVMEKKYGPKIDRSANYRQTIIESVDGSLKRLGTDHLDILMCPHGASSPEELRNYPEVFDGFDALKQAGKVRYLGVSSHSDPAGVLTAATMLPQYSVAMVAYNIVNAPFMDEAITAAHAGDMGVIAMKVARAVYPGPNRGEVDPKRIAKLASKAPGTLKVPQQAYVWALRNKSLSAVISNMVNDQHVSDNLPLPILAAKLGKD